MNKLLTILVIIFLASCTKVNIESEKHYMGAIKDADSVLAKVPVIVSQPYFQSKGKPPKPVVVPPTVKIPTVTISQPLNSSQPFHLGDNITIKAQALDYSGTGIKMTYFYLDGVLKDSSTNYQPTFIWNTSNSNTGLHTITIKAKDGNNNTGQSYVIVSLDAAILPPLTLPSSVLLSCPPVGNQGSEGSCVAFAVNYYAESIEYHYKTGLPYNYSTIFSPEFVYNQTNVGSCIGGSAMINNLNYIVSNGNVKWATVPYSDNNGCTITPTQSQITEAANNKIKSYSQVLGSDPTAIKTMIALHHPLTFTFPVDNNFSNAGKDYVWKQFGLTNWGSHAITLIGYDDVKRAYRCVNSWGVGWSDNGFIWIDYDFFPTVVFQLFVQNP